VIAMSVSFPANLIYVKHHDDQHKNVLLIENKPEIVKLTDGRKIHLLIENPATKKPEPVPLTEDQKNDQFVIAIAAFFVLLAICMVCTFFATI
jgi:hypothetical protein